MARLPWWVSLVLGMVAWVWFWFEQRGWSEKMREGAFWTVTGLMAMLFGGAAVGSGITARRNRQKLLNIQTMRDLKEVSGEEFEELTAAFYREQGWAVMERGEPGKPDGGYDLVLRKDGQRVLVQCKQRTKQRIGVAVVREFYGVVVSQGADRGIFVTTSEFTPDAMAFGLSQALLELIPGERLAQMVGHLRRTAESPAVADKTGVAAPAMDVSPPCPLCKGIMLRKVAGKSGWKGQAFWSCQSFPRCRGKLHIGVSEH